MISGVSQRGSILAGCVGRGDVIGMRELKQRIQGSRLFSEGADVLAALKLKDFTRLYAPASVPVFDSFYRVLLTSGSSFTRVALPDSIREVMLGATFLNNVILQGRYLGTFLTFLDDPTTPLPPEFVSAAAHVPPPQGPTPQTVLRRIVSGRPESPGPDPARRREGVETYRRAALLDLLSPQGGGGGIDITV